MACAEEDTYGWRWSVLSEQENARKKANFGIDVCICNYLRTIFGSQLPSGIAVFFLFLPYCASKDISKGRITEAASDERWWKEREKGISLPLFSPALPTLSYTLYGAYYTDLHNWLNDRWSEKKRGKK